MIVTVIRNDFPTSLIECEQITKEVTDEKVIIECWSADELIERIVLAFEKADVYISNSDGKTVDAIHFKGG